MTVQKGNDVLQAHDGRFGVPVTNAWRPSAVPDLQV